MIKFNWKLITKCLFLFQKRVKDGTLIKISKTWNFLICSGKLRNIRKFRKSPLCPQTFNITYNPQRIPAVIVETYCVNHCLLEYNCIQTTKKIMIKCKNSNRKTTLRVPICRPNLTIPIAKEEENFQVL